MFTGEIILKSLGSKNIFPSNKIIFLQCVKHTERLCPTPRVERRVVEKILENVVHTLCTSFSIKYDQKHHKTRHNKAFNRVARHQCIGGMAVSLRVPIGTPIKKKKTAQYLVTPRQNMRTMGKIRD